MCDNRGIGSEGIKFVLFEREGGQVICSAAFTWDTQQAGNKAQRRLHCVHGNLSPSFFFVNTNVQVEFWAPFEHTVFLCIDTQSRVGRPSECSQTTCFGHGHAGSQI